MTIADQLQANGGMTLAAVHGTLVEAAPATGYAVASKGGHVVSLRDFAFDFQTVDAFYDFYRQPLGDPEYIGLWLDKGLVYIDAVQVVQNIRHAVTLAQNHGQKAFYSFEAQVSLYLEGK